VKIRKKLLLRAKKMKIVSIEKSYLAEWHSHP
jgi:hypothetical protein